MAADNAGSALARLVSWLVLPLAPMYGTLVAYRIYHPPRRRYNRLPGDVGLEAEEATVRAGRVRLHLWIARGAAPDRIVIVGHGIGQSKAASLVHAAFLHGAGYTVCLFDHRNHGTSTQDRSAWGQSRRFTDDVEAVLGYVREQLAPPGAKVALFGFSFSSFPSFYILGRPACAVDAVVTESGPAVDVHRLYRNLVASGALPLHKPFRYGVARRAVERVFSRLATAMLQANWPPAPEGAFVTTPMLFLTGGDDPIVPTEEVFALAEPCPLARVEVLPGAAHLQGHKTDPEAYERTVLGFLGRAFDTT